MKTLSLLLTLLLSACAMPDYLSPQDLQPAATHYNLDQQNLFFNLKWTQGPQTPEASEFILSFWDKNLGPNSEGPYRDPTNELAVILWMPSMGHGSAPVKVEKLQPGVYRVSNVYFIMPGDWQIQITIKQGAQILDQNFVDLIL